MPTLNSVGLFVLFPRGGSAESGAEWCLAIGKVINWELAHMWTPTRACTYHNTPCKCFHSPPYRLVSLPQMSPTNSVFKKQTFYSSSSSITRCHSFLLPLRLQNKMRIWTCIWMLMLSNLNQPPITSSLKWVFHPVHRKRGLPLLHEPSFHTSIMDAWYPITWSLSCPSFFGWKFLPILPPYFT